MTAADRIEELARKAKGTPNNALIVGADYGLAIARVLRAACQVDANRRDFELWHKASVPLDGSMTLDNFAEELERRSKAVVAGLDDLRAAAVCAVAG